jgi:hypothetical protein
MTRKAATKAPAKDSQGESNFTSTALSHAGFLHRHRFAG